MNSRTLSEGTRVRVIEGIHQTDPSYRAETVGVVEGWDEEPTGAWFASDRDGRLQLQRLKLRKSDGKVSVLTIDDHTSVQPADSGGEQGRLPEPSEP